MNSGLRTSDPTIVSAFRTTLLHQALIALVILGLLALAWNFLRASQLRRAAAGQSSAMSWPYPEPTARRLLRIGFGLLWILDGLLQAQPSMPLGMAPLVIEPTAASSPTWVQHLENAAATIWSNHPITAPSSVVWIQVGLGVWLLVAARGNWSRLAGAASACWGVVVWVFGESFGGIFAPGLTWAFGAPGAVLFYAMAGILIALPDRAWETPRLGRIILAVVGAFFVGMAVLQAWPGRGFWSGSLHHGVVTGTLASMAQQMSTTSQPGLFASLARAFASFDATNAFAVNLFLVIALAALGVAFLSGRPRIVRVAVIAGAVLCVADWVFVEDLGFFGGVGTDPNSMIPLVLVFVAGYVAMTRLPVRVPAEAAAPVAPAPAVAALPAVAAGPAVAADAATTDAPEPAPTGWRRIASSPSYAFRCLAAVGALGVILVGAVPMAAASVNSTADPIIAQAIDGSPGVVDTPAPPFTLMDQTGRQVSLASLRGKAVALTFLDPVCVSDCPLIAQEFRQADEMLGGTASRVEMVAVVANPLYRAQPYLVAFNHQEGLNKLPNWTFLTGSSAQLVRTWGAFGIQIQFEPGGAMIAHNDVAYVIDPHGRTRYILNTDPGPGTQASKSSFAAVLAGEIRSALAS